MLINIFVFLYLLVLPIAFVIKGKKHISYLFLLVGSNIMPLLNFGIKFSSFYIIPFTALVIYLINNKKGRLNRSSKLYLTASLFLLLITIVAWITNGNQNDAAVIPILATVTIITTLYLLFVLLSSTNISVTQWVFKSSIHIIVILNFIAVLVQIIFPKSYYFFLELYGSESRTVIGTTMDALESGSLVIRQKGLYFSEVLLGANMLVCFSYLFVQHLKNSNRKDFALTILCVLVGLASLSKLFIIGSILIASISLLFLKKIHARSYIGLLLFFACLNAFISWIVRYNKELGQYINYYFDFIFRPFDALSTRYGSGESDDYILKQTYEVITNNLLIGVGPGSVYGEFVGDSTYIAILHNTGLIGLLVFIATLLIVGRTLFLKASKVEFIIFIALLLTGISSVSFVFSYNYLPYIIFILTFSYSSINKQKHPLTKEYSANFTDHTKFR